MLGLVIKVAKGHCAFFDWAYLKVSIFKVAIVKATVSNASEFKFAIFKRAIDKRAILKLRCVEHTGLKDYISEGGERKQRARYGQAFKISTT